MALSFNIQCFISLYYMFYITFNYLIEARLITELALLSRVIRGYDKYFLCVPTHVLPKFGLKIFKRAHTQAYVFI